MKLNVKEPVREQMLVEELKAWNLNPRGGELRGIEEFAEQIRADGGIREDLHVFLLNGVATLLAGHRRHAAAQVLGLEAVWCKCYGELAPEQAFLLLLSLQQGNDPFDSRELALGARTAISLGLTLDDIVGPMHRSPETVQLYLDLEKLPHNAQEAVYKGRLALETAGLLRRIETAQLQREAVQMVLHDAITKEPMSPAQARHFIEETYLKPARWRKEWLALVPKLKRKHPVAEGFHFVEWESRGEHVQGEVGYCLPGWCQADEHVASELLVNPKEPMTWGALALKHGAQIYVVPAPNHKEGYVLVVSQKMVRAAEEVTAEDERVLRVGKASAQQRRPSLDHDHEPEGQDGTATDLPNSHEELEQDSGLHEGTVEMVAAALVKCLERHPESAMRDACWVPLMRTVFELLASHLPEELHARLQATMQHDSGPRRGLRWCLTGLALIDHCAAEADDGFSAIDAVLDALGADITRED